MVREDYLTLLHVGSWNLWSSRKAANGLQGGCGRTLEAHKAELESPVCTVIQDTEMNWETALGWSSIPLHRCQPRGGSPRG